MATISQRQSFVSRAYQAAREAGLSGPQADLAVAQAVHETAWGTKPSGVNNYHGIKGKGTTVKTHEIVAGRRVNIRDSFRNFSSMADSFKAWADLVGRKWSGALTAPTLKEAVKALRAGQPGGYATDPNYNAKIGRIGSMIGAVGNIKDVAGPWGAPKTPTPTPAPRNMSTKAGQIAYAGLTKSLAPASPMTPQQAYGQMASTMADAGVRNIGGWQGGQTYGAPLGAVERGPLGAPQANPANAPQVDHVRQMPSGPVPSSTFSNMVAGMDSPVYGANKLPGRDVATAPQVAPTSANFNTPMPSAPPQRPSALDANQSMAPSVMSAAYGQWAGPMAAATMNDMMIGKNMPVSLEAAPKKTAPAPTTANLASQYGLMGSTLKDQGVTISGAPAALEAPTPEAPATTAAVTEAPKQPTVPSPVQNAPKKPQTVPAPTNDYPAAPTLHNLTPQQVNNQVRAAKVGNAIKKNAPAIAASLAFGPIAGLAVKYGAPMLGKALGGIGQSIFGGTPNPARTTYGYGVDAMGSILGGGGVAGSTAYSRSTPGYSATNLGNGMISRTNQYGVTSYSRANPGNSPTGYSFGGPDAKGFSGGVFGGKSSSSKSSKSEKK